MFINNKLDNYVNKKARLEIKKTELVDRMNEQNAKIETKIKSLTDLTFRNKDIVDNEVAEINRQINKMNKLIKIEVDYAKELTKGDENE